MSEVISLREQVAQAELAAQVLKRKPDPNVTREERSTTQAVFLNCLVVSWTDAPPLAPESFRYRVAIP